MLLCERIVRVVQHFKDRIDIVEEETTYVRADRSVLSKNAVNYNNANLFKQLFFSQLKKRIIKLPKSSMGNFFSDSKQIEDDFITKNVFLRVI